jgi:hypothetical protein
MSPQKQAAPVRLARSKTAQELAEGILEAGEDLKKVAGMLELLAGHGHRILPALGGDGIGEFPATLTMLSALLWRIAGDLEYDGIDIERNLHTA